MSTYVCGYCVCAYEGARHAYVHTYVHKQSHIRTYIHYCSDKGFRIPYRHRMLSVRLHTYVCHVTGQLGTWLDKIPGQNKATKTS